MYAYKPKKQCIAMIPKRQNDALNKAELLAVILTGNSAKQQTFPQVMTTAKEARESADAFMPRLPNGEIGSRNYWLIEFNIQQETYVGVLRVLSNGNTVNPGKLLHRLKDHIIQCVNSNGESIRQPEIQANAATHLTRIRPSR